MRVRSTLLGVSLCLASLGATGSARAGGMDPTPERLVVQPANLPQGQTCQSIAFNPEVAIGAGLSPSAFPCRPDNAAFRNMVAELGFALAPTAFYPARTTGIAGFSFGIEASYTKINSDAFSDAANGQRTQYWHAGTRGSVDSAANRFSVVNNSPDSFLQVYALKIRKGLPFGLEFGGSLGTVANSNMWVIGGDFRWALLEGFRTGALGYLPDLSIGTGARTMTGTSKFYLTTAAFDVKLSKPIKLVDSSVLTPSLGYQRLFIFGDATVLDGTPNVDALQQCGYQGPNPSTGIAQCANKYSNGQAANADFNNHFTFDRVRIHRHRGLAALHYKYEFVQIGGQFAVDLTSPGDENPGLVGDRQWTMSFEAGAAF